MTTHPGSSAPVPRTRPPATAFVVVRAYLPDDVGRILVVRLPPHRHPVGGYWYLPGGRIRAGETPHEAMARKLRADLGLKDHPESAELALTDFTRARFATHPRQTLLFRYAPVTDPDALLRRLVPDTEEVSEVTWLDPTQVRKLLYPLQAAAVLAMYAGQRYLEQDALPRGHTPPAG